MSWSRIHLSRRNVARGYVIPGSPRTQAEERTGDSLPDGKWVRPVTRTASTSNSTTARRWHQGGRHGSMLLGCAAHHQPVAVRRWAACACGTAPPACRRKPKRKPPRWRGKPDRLPPVTAQPKVKMAMVVIKPMVIHVWCGRRPEQQQKGAVSQKEKALPRGAAAIEIEITAGVVGSPRPWKKRAT